MSKTEIPHDQWPKFFENFNRQNADKIVKIEVTDDEDYRIDYAESLPFKSVRIISKKDDNTTVAVSAGTSNSFSHSIDKTSAIILEERQDAGQQLEIKSSLGKTAIVRFHPLEESDDLM
ncbi:MAG: DUF5335 family protein [Bacteroidota bacterium]|nr:DUF5335 family protein [Bacteroidota bacterium]MDP4192831.1 DUF5335 family protein [Bacteroidota bacterium]MDP4196745.1 DUF5335 family protein [Bacteroidota bacterium]